MEVVKFVRFEENGEEINLYFKICDRLADFVRKNTNYCEKVLSLYLDNENQFCYTISRTDTFEEIRQSLVETIERISNESDDVHFYNHLVTNEGHHRSPSEIHTLMRTEYGLADINEQQNENADGKDIDLEWWTAHFFISFERLLFNEADELACDEGGMIHTAASASEVSEFLKILKSIDTIFVVDDVRKLGPKDIKRLREERATNKQEGEIE